MPIVKLAPDVTQSEPSGSHHLAGRSRSSRGIGLTGVGTALLFAIMIASGNAGASVHADAVVKAPYKGSTNSPYFSVTASGCAAASAMELRWSKLTGMIHGADSTSSKTCNFVRGGGNAGGTSISTNSISLSIPFAIGSSGSHAIASSWTVALTSTQSQRTGGCPANMVNPYPPLGNSQGALCQDSAGLTFTLSEALMDSSNGAWYSFNSSAANSYRTLGWENSTSCYNYGTPVCSNYTGPTGYAYSTGSNDPGFSAFTFNGTTTFTLWNNATGMVSGHHYVLMVTLGLSATSYAFTYNLKHPWTSASVSSINMAKSGYGAKLNSISIT